MKNQVAAGFAFLSITSVGFAQGLDIEGGTEDIMLYVAAGDYCGFAIDPAANEVGAFYQIIDPDAFKRGSLKGVAIFKGLKLENKEIVCTGAKASRPGMDEALRAQSKSLAKMRADRKP